MPKETKRQTHSPSTLSRRKLLGYAAGVLGAAVAGTIGKARFEKQATRNEITVGLVVHQDQRDTAHHNQLLTTAKILGRPFHAIGLEVAGLAQDKVESEITKRKTAQQHIADALDTQAGTKFTLEERDRLRADLARTWELKPQEMRSNKSAQDKYDASVAELRGILINEVHTKLYSPQYKFGTLSAALDVLSFAHQTPIVPIEWYPKPQAQAIRKKYEKAQDCELEALEKPSLEQQLPLSVANYRAWAEIVAERNGKIIELMPQVIELIRQQHPEVVQKHLQAFKQGNVRMVYLLGQLHNGVALASVPGFEITPSFDQKYSAFPRRLTDKLERNPRTALTESEKHILTLAYAVQPVIAERLAKQRGDFSSSVISGIARATKEDFGYLNRTTAGKPPMDRARTIFDYFTLKP